MKKIAMILALMMLGGALMAQNVVKVEMKTSLGDIVLELYPDKAPITVENFVNYVNEGFYDGLVFHRVISNFMIQGGGFDEGHKQKSPTQKPIKNEANNGLSNERGTIAMARTNNPHSATSQFFINVKDNLFLDYAGERNWGYCVFGKVISGMEIVDKIKVSETGIDNKTGMRDWPKTEIIIKSMKIVNDKKTSEK